MFTPKAKPQRKILILQWKRRGLAKELKQRSYYKEHIHRWEEGTGKCWEEGTGSTEHPVLVGIFLEQVAAAAVSSLKAVEVAVKDSQR